MFSKAFWVDVAGVVLILAALGWVLKRSGAALPSLFTRVGNLVHAKAGAAPVAGQDAQSQAVFTNAPTMGAGYWQAGWFPPNQVPTGILPNPLAPASVQSIQGQAGQAIGGCATCGG